jgi:hypothetical protein
MNTINSISSLLFTEFAKMGKYVAVNADGNILFVQVGESNTRILNWETMPSSNILEIAKGLTIKESFRGSTLLHG